MWTNGFTNVVEERFDAGIRMGESISKDMIAVRIGPDWRLAVVGSSAYFDQKPPPETPHDLTEHACVNIRHKPSGAMDELDARIRRIEATLCSAITQRFELGVQHADSPYAHTLARHWRPSEPLRRAVVEYVVPVPDTPGTHNTREVATS
jgi:hypothetical protein